MIIAAKYIVIVFGISFIAVSFLMLIKPIQAKEIIKKAGSTNLINYGEITIRMIPAAAMIIYADFSKFAEVFKIVGWFMIATSLVLYVVPRRLHHAYAVNCANMLHPKYITLLAPFSAMMGCALIYAVL